MKNKFEELVISNFLVEEVSDSYPLQLGDPITSKTNTTITVNTDWNGQGFVYLTYIDKGAVVDESEEEEEDTDAEEDVVSDEEDVASDEEEADAFIQESTSETSTELSQWKELQWKELVFNKNTVYRGFT